MKLSRIVYDYRMKHNLSQRAFAAQCGLSNSYISFLERESNPRTLRPVNPSIDQYKKLAKGMDMSVNTLFSMLDDTLVPLDPTLEERIDVAVTTLNKAGKLKVLEYIEDIRGRYEA